jgi:hypothetical protein
VGPRASLDRCKKSRPHRDSISETIGLLSCASTRDPSGSTIVLSAVILQSHGRAAVVHYSAASSQLVGCISYNYFVSPPGNIDLLHLMDVTDLV